MNSNVPLLAGLLLCMSCSTAHQSEVSGLARLSKTCEIEFGYRNESALFGDSEFIAIFGKDIPIAAKSLAEKLENRDRRWFRSELAGYLAASKFYSLTDNLLQLNELTKTLKSHEVFELHNRASIHASLNWDVGLSWLAKDAYLADHYLNIWFLNRDKDYLSKSLQSVKAILSTIAEARSNALPNIFGPYWRDNQPKAAEETIRLQVARLAKPITIARLVDPSLLSAVGISVDEANSLIEEFATHSDNSVRFHLESLVSHMSETPVLHDEYPSSEDAEQSLSEPISGLVDVLFWRAIAEQSIEGFKNDVQEITEEYTGAKSCARMSLQALVAVKSIELNTVFGGLLVDPGQIRQFLNEILSIHKNLGEQAESNDSSSLLGYPRILSVLQSLDQNEVAQLTRSK